MVNEDRRAILSSFQEGALSLDQTLDALMRVDVCTAGFQDLGFACVDTARASRQGAGEVIYGEGKTSEQIISIAQALLDANDGHVLATRVNSAKAAEVIAGWGDAYPQATYHRDASCLVFGGIPPCSGRGIIAIVSAGTSDAPIVAEAELTARFLGNEVDVINDVGVAGVHRLLASKQRLEHARVVVVIAGMEGALASVVGGLVSVPVIAVPTSIGYGASFSGLAALLSMLNSCASGVSVVNIDNGFGAAYQASLINHLP